MSDAEYPVFEEEPLDSQARLFADAEFIENPEPRCPCVLVLDTSMDEDRLQEVQAGVTRLRSELLTDELAAKRVEVAVVAYGPTRVESHFQTPEFFDPPYVSPGSGKPMGEALELAVQLVCDRKDTYKEAGIQYYRPWILLLTDGAPDDDWETAAELLRGLEREGAVAFHAVGVEGADMDLLALLATRDPHRLDGVRFKDLFSWLGRSLQRVSHSRVGTEIELPETGAWALVP